MDNKTAMMELRDKLLSVYEELKESSSEHLLGYSEALKNIANDIDAQMLKAERKQIEQAYNKGYTDAELEWTGSTQEDISQYSDAKIYYNQTYTQNNNSFFESLQKAVSKHKHPTITTQSGSINEQGR